MPRQGQDVTMTILLKCSECGVFLRGGADVCPGCGMEIEHDVVKCGRCGAWTDPRSPFCTVCKVTFETERPPERRGWFRKPTEGFYRLTVRRAMSLRDFES